MSRARLVVTWILQLLLGLVFILTGVGKFPQWDGWVSRFEMWGYAAWFLAVVAVLEALGGVLVLLPKTAAYGASLIGAVMLGAAYTHASTGIGSPTQVAIPILVCAAVVALRWKDRWRPPVSID